MTNSGVRDGESCLFSFQIRTTFTGQGSGMDEGEFRMRGVTRK